MRFLKLWLRVVLLGAILLAGRGALAAPVTCSYGYQDSTCGTNLYNAPQVAPTCLGTAGWTTAAAAQWIGSSYSAPQCNYQAAPVCPSGYVQTGPFWNGSTWVGLNCTPAAPPDPTAGCMANLPAGWTISGRTGDNRNTQFPPGTTGLFFEGTGDTWVDKCGTTHLNTLLVCNVRTADSGFISWGQIVNYSVGTCGH